ncbi:hypothetical protein OIU80_11700 [Flavobacterium sp. LS1R47]|uniref:Uncharacterized protein n=1 Tax=Flavobacterium frigoritolerans TaxID=2987686 RepID=A0A9X2ZLF0_9FLAO|nr:hypothetical protein [Flavobacterium frigoritolerans]MCV9932945.1 hypothetical protein [Flavobacterium frigoritolerans]
MTRTEKILGTLFCLTMVFFIYLSNRDESKNNEMINKSKFTTIAKVYEIKSGKTYTYARFYFFFNQEKYYSGDYVSNDMRKTINRYYRVDLSSVDPKYSKIHLDQEVTDSIEIVKAGFKYK